MKNLIEQLESEIKILGCKNLKADGFYKVALAAALVKSYEFMKLSVNHDDDSKVYFTLGSLRGICEDFIVLTFLKKLDSEYRDRAVGASMNLKVQESLMRQKLFFDRERCFQPVIQPTDENEDLIRKYKQHLKDIGKKTGAWGENTAMPKIHVMAENLGFGDFYQYFYTLSSETVHFNPRILLRMGWSEKDDMENFQFSTENFSTYYRLYGFVYSILLFIKFSRNFLDILQLSSGFVGVINTLEEKLDDILRWPEPVTYEEMNQKGPNDFFRLMLKTVKKSGDL